MLQSTSSSQLQPRLTLVLGGARSGKSRCAEELIGRMPSPWAYIATAEALDEEMRARIAHHRARRDGNWRTIEAPLDLSDTISAFDDAGHPILVDCLTLWLSNCLLADRDLDKDSERLMAVLERAPGPIVLVSNEVGLGIVPDTPLGRRFRDAQGRLNQQVASVADRVIMMVAGIPLIVK